jgi:hypothetical protein
VGFANGMVQGQELAVTPKASHEKRDNYAALVASMRRLNLSGALIKCQMIAAFF